MKKLYSTVEYKFQNERRINDREKRNLRYKRKRRNKNRGRLGKSSEVLQIEQAFKGFKRLAPPHNFSLIDNPEEALEFVGKLEHCYLRRQKVLVKLDDLEYLDYTAVTVLISVMITFKSKNIAFNGSFPKNQALKRLLFNSGFLKHIHEPFENSLHYSIGNPHQIFTRANKEVNSELGFYVMQEASETIWGAKRVCKGLQRTLLELMQNTNNHAGRNEKGSMHWWLSVNHDKKNNKVKFVFVDYGIGIFESLKSKPEESKWFNFNKILTRLTSPKNTEIFRQLLEGELHMTVTGKPYRGKGLPGIKEVMDRNQISELRIISNDVYSNVSKSEYIELRNKFSGTLVYWELNSQNLSSEWNQN